MVNAVLVTDAVQVAESAARLSVTVTLPSEPEMVEPAKAAPRFTEAGTVMSRLAVDTVKVTMVSPDGAAAAGDATASTAAPAARASNGFFMPTTLNTEKVQNSHSERITH